MKKCSSAYTIIELLVVVALFSIISYLVARSMAMVLQGSRKSQSETDIRSSLDYAVSVISRHLYNSERIISVNTNRIEYIDEWGVAGRYFECYSADNSTPRLGRVASSSATSLLTNLKNVYITSCNFSCNIASIPQSCDISISGNSTESANPISTTVTSSVVLRNY